MITMIPIDSYVTTILNATYGEEVRDAIANALLVMNDNYKYGKTSGKGLPNSIKILGVGNSYTRDSFRWLWKILTDAGVKDVVVGHGYIGGITLTEQWASITDDSDENHEAFEYWKYSTGQDPLRRTGWSLAQIFNDEIWDVALFQNQSDLAGWYGSYASLRTTDPTFGYNFITYLQSFHSETRQNPLKLGILLPWSHATGYSSSNYASKHGSDPMIQLKHNKNVCPRVAYENSMDYVVNIGDAIDMARDHGELSTLGVELCKPGTQVEPDLNHLAAGIPQYLASFCIATTVLGVMPRDVTWYPTLADDPDIDTDNPTADIKTSAYLAMVAKQCAYSASLIPVMENDFAPLTI